MAFLDDIIDNFFQTKITELNDYNEHIDDPASLVKIIAELTDRMQDTQDLSDKGQLEQYYLTDLPENMVVFPDEVLAIHEVLLDFYQFLQENGYLTVAEYKDLLFFLQKNKHNFISRMDDKQFWSQEKRKRMANLDQEMMDAMPPEVNDLFQSLNNIFQEEANNGQKNNVIDFPSNQGGELTNAAPYAVQLRIDLIEFKPPIWRRVLVPFDYTLADLHEVIQTCFEWEDEHLHQFIVGRMYYEAAEMDLDDFGEFFTGDTSSITVGEVFEQFKTIDYIYDFGDDWEHKIKFEANIPFAELPKDKGALSNVEPEQLPICLTGRQGAPLENSAGQDEFAPFDIDKINANLSDI